MVGGIALFGGLLPPGQQMAELRRHPIEFGLIQTVRLLGLIGGVFVLRGFNWARWLLIFWLAFHVALSAFHSRRELMVHGLLFVVVAHLLFRAPAAAYFRSARVEPRETPNKSP